MEAWTRVIVEWINCLGIAQPFVDDLRELRNCVLYHKLVRQLCPSDTGEVTSNAITGDEQELVSEFLRAEYPECMTNGECATELTDELYIASLLLVQCSQKPSFHRPMCLNLKPETQVSVKKFLEMVLPYGKTINREIVAVAITETVDVAPNTLASTPVVRPLREFFNSPAARPPHSQRFDRNRELRRLKAQLETERFEKADLAEDVRIQDEKIRNLQKKLEEKSQELKTLKREKLNPPTPQSCRKNNNRPSDNEERYRRESEQLEITNLGLQSEIEKLQEELEELSRQLTSKNRLHSAAKEKIDQYERNVEGLSIQLEMKNTELLNLRMNNEELREHIREMQKSSLGEQSFEMEPINRARSPLFMNCSEALSSIVDIQLQEAKEESSQLKIQLDNANERLDVALRECEEIRRFNEILKDKASELDVVNSSLLDTKERLVAMTKSANVLELEKAEFIANLGKLESSLISNKELLALAENRRDAFATELAETTVRNNDLKVSLEREKSRTRELESMISREKEERENLQTRLDSIEDELNRVEEVKAAVENDLREKLEKLHRSETNLSNEKLRTNELESIVADARKQSEDLRIMLENRDESLSRVIEEKEKLESRLRESMEIYAESQISLKSERIKIAEIESTFARNREEYRDLQDLLRSNEENLTSVNEDKNTLEFNLKEIEKHLEECEIRLSNEKTTVAELESILASNKKESENFKQQLASTDEELSIVKKTNESLRSNILDNEKKLLQSEASLKNEKVQVTELETTISRLQKNCDDLQEDLRLTKQSLTTEKSRVTDLETALTRGEKNTEDLRNIVEELKIALANEKSATADLKDIVSRSENNCKELERLLKSKEDHLEEFQQRANSLNTELENCRLRIIDLQSSLNYETLRSAELDSERLRLEENCASLETELASKEKILVQTETSKTNVETELNEINLKMRETKSHLANLQKEINQLEEEKRENLLATEKMEKYAKKADEKIISLEAEIVDLDKRFKDLEEKSAIDKKDLQSLRSVLSEKISTIEELSSRLEETENREITIKSGLEVANKKIAELTELGEEVESQLVQEREQLTALRAHKKSLNDELASHVRSEADLKEEIRKINEKLMDSETKLQEQIDENIVLNKDKFELQDAKNQLEKQLATEQQKLATISSEKQNLEQELASHVLSAAKMKERIEKIETELENCGTNLEKQIEANEILKTDNIELTKLRSKMESEIVQLREESTLAEAEKIALNQELSSNIQFSTEMRERIVKIEKELQASTLNEEKQREVIDKLEEKIRELEELRTKLENELIDERESLKDLRSEKEMIESELSLYGRSNENLGNKIISLEERIEEYSAKLQKERETNVELKQFELNMNEAREKLEKELTQERERSSIVEIAIKTLETKLSAHERSKDDMNEEISALHGELEASRKEFQQLRATNDKLRSQLTKSDSTIELLRDHERQNQRLTVDCEKTTKELSKSRLRIEELSENLKTRLEEITILENRFENSEREKKRSIENLEERLRTTNDLAESLRQRLMIAEKSCAESKLEEKLKNEAMEIVRSKLEQLSKEKIESELRMKEIIVNLQEVRSSQDEVLKAQSKTIKEKIARFEEAEKELVELRKSLTVELEKIEVEKSIRRETEIQCEKLKEHNNVQSNLVKELRIALDIEHNEVLKSTEIREKLENNVKEITKTSEGLKRELNAIFESLREFNPEIVESRAYVEDSVREIDESDVLRVLRIVQSFVTDAETIRRAIFSLNRTNDKLKNNTKEIVGVSKSLKLELDALWDSVRRACPELARLKEKSNLDVTSKNRETSEISQTVKSFADDAKTIRKAVSILSEANETLKEHLDGEKEMAKNSADEAEKRKLEMNERIANLEAERTKRNLYLAHLVEKKKKLQETLSMAVTKRDRVDDCLEKSIDKWRTIVEKSGNFLDPGSSDCDELKHLRVKRMEIDVALSAINERRARTLKPLLQALCRIFVWSEEKLQEAQKSFEIARIAETTGENELSEEREMVEMEIRENEETQLLLASANEKIDDFTRTMKSYETNLKSGAIKRSTSAEEKLQSQLEKLTKERKDMKEKLDAARMRNAKMEKNMDELRNENKKLKSEAMAVVKVEDCSGEIEKLRTLTETLEKEVSRLRMENEELTAKKGTNEGEMENRLKEVHNEYGQKLEKIKQKMKTAYNEQIAKLNQEQEKTLKENTSALRVQMEKQCRKYTEDIAKYKAHISDLSSRYWDVGEKLLAETQEKQSALQRLDQLRGYQDKHEAVAEVNQQMSVTQSRHKTASLDRRDFVADRATRDVATRPGYRAVQVIEEETTTYSTRRHSVKSIQAMGNAFNAEDEESELFDSVYLTDLKEGRCVPVAPDFDRLSELRMRNSMCRPHLKSSYAVETHFQPIALNEDDIKNGVTGEDVFNDSLSQSLLPGQKPKKKDRTQTSYKKPGPPTPSKNGGRLSLQSNELKSPGSRVLRERNVERRTTATPRGLKNLFGTSTSKRQDENATGTPKGRRLSNIFRKQRTERN